MGLKITYLVDTGAAISVMDTRLLQHCLSRLKKWLIKIGKVVTATGQPLNVIGVYDVPISLCISKRTQTFSHPFLVADGLSTKAIIGADFLARFGASIDARTKKVTFQNGESHYLVTKEDCIIPPFTN
jgi:hypothetical protein